MLAYISKCIYIYLYMYIYVCVCVCTSMRAMYAKSLFV